MSCPGVKRFVVSKESCRSAKTRHTTFRVRRGPSLNSKSGFGLRVKNSEPIDRDGNPTEDSMVGRMHLCMLFELGP